MNLSVVYIVNRLLFRIGDFFHHWYADGSRTFFHFFTSTLESMDQRLVFRVTLKHIFEPLYKDYTIIGRIIGFIFRSIRLFFGFIAYVIFGAFFIVIYLVWLVLPIAILAMASKQYIK